MPLAACLSDHRRGDLRRGFYPNRTHAPGNGARCVTIVSNCKSFCATALHERPRANCLPRRRPDGSRYSSRVRLCRLRGCSRRLQAARHLQVSSDLQMRCVRRFARRLPAWRDLDCSTSARLIELRHEFPSYPNATRRGVVVCRRHLRGRARGARSQTRRHLRVRPRYAGPAPIIASTTSTIFVDDLSDAVAYPERFLERTLAQSGLSRSAGGIVARREDGRDRDACV